jgi:hypothetical protein
MEKENLLKVAGKLLMSVLPEFSDCYPKNFPLHVLKDIREHNEVIRDMCVEIRRIYSKL